MKDKNETYSYLGGLMHGIGSLLTGMKTTMTVFLPPESNGTISGKPCDPGNVRPFPRNADHAPQ